MYQYASGLLALVAALLLYFSKVRRARLPLPPGPRGVPLLGNLLDLPSSFEWITYHKWCEELGTDILYLNVMGQSVIVLESQAASDLLDKRSSIYSSRPRFPFLVELVGATYNLGVMKYGERWRQHRRLANGYFSANTPDNFRPQSVRAARNLLFRLMDTTKDLKNELLYTSGDIILSVCYGLDLKTEDGVRNFETVEKGMRAIHESVVPGRFLVDFLPVLKYVPGWIPGAGFQRTARLYKRDIHDMINSPFAVVEKNIASGSCPPCFCCTNLDFDVDPTTESVDVVRGTAGAMYGAGSDTTAAAVASCILGLLKRPDVFARARADLDSIIKPGHLPEFTDEPSLPFITAIAKESLRWKEVTSLGVPHYNEIEDEYRGYRIPAGSIIMANQWAMLHDEALYPDPFTFKPERFMKGDSYDDSIKDPESFCWGFGRRICPGRNIALASIWIIIASLIYAFDVDKAVDENGNVLEPDPAYTSELVHAPGPYPCRIRPRSEAFADLVKLYQTA